MSRRRGVHLDLGQVCFLEIAAASVAAHLAHDHFTMRMTRCRLTSCPRDPASKGEAPFDDARRLPDSADSILDPPARRTRSRHNAIHRALGHYEPSSAPSDRSRVKPRELARLSRGSRCVHSRHFPRSAISVRASLKRRGTVQFLWNKRAFFIRLLSGCASKFPYNV